MDEIFKILRNKVALVNGDATKPADSDARGAEPADEDSLVPPTTQTTPGDLKLVWRAPRVLVRLPGQTWFLDVVQKYWS